MGRSPTTGALTPGITMFVWSRGRAKTRGGFLGDQEEEELGEEEGRQAGSGRERAGLSCVVAPRPTNRARGTTAWAQVTTTVTTTSVG